MGRYILERGLERPLAAHALYLEYLSSPYQYLWLLATFRSFTPTRKRGSTCRPKRDVSPFPMLWRPCKIKEHSVQQKTKQMRLTLCRCTVRGRQITATPPQMFPLAVQLLQEVAWRNHLSGLCVLFQSCWELQSAPAWPEASPWILFF